MVTARDEGKGRRDGEQLLTDRLKTLEQGVIYCDNTMPKSELGVSQLDRLGMMVTAGDEGKGRGDGEQLLTSRLKNSDQGVIHCYNRMPKSELGASRPDRLGKMMLAGGEGKCRGDGEQLLTSRLKNSDQGVINCYNRMPKSELGVSQLDRLGTMVTARDEGKSRGDGEKLLTDRLKH